MKEHIKHAVVCGQTTSGSCHSKENLEQMSRDLIEEANRRNLAAKPSSL